MVEKDPNVSDTRNRSLMELGAAESIILFVLFFSVLVITTYLIACLLIEISHISPTERDIIVLLSLASLSGSSIFYARKLYKAGINRTYNFNPKTFSVERASTIAYFIIRLPTSVIFSLVVYALWRISIDIAIEPKFDASKSPIYLFLVMGFFTGFSSGKFITYFERDGVKLAKSGGVNNEQS